MMDKSNLINSGHEKNLVGGIPLNENERTLQLSRNYFFILFNSDFFALFNIESSWSFNGSLCY